ncbi:SLBB domain-containing protein [Pedobacter insulae]|uniref:Protein involved in polysaccharide export, contains SLBB domain of the beta-grasp fold n=1 Tax=Pedobacter insulae TaxID=414048 RepID=A0A1I2TIB3_9SPHI|nr:SLBB domain-containing protein [Pedobacter insulae]SFG62071.1 protein involved in polysaccharide export, contains SLBB domain of the beta-grasp fold [Pedobacter insulae]
MKFKRIYLLLCFFTLLFATPVLAQTNYADVKVDDLTDTQIRQLIQRAESIGFDDAQLEQMAAAQGMKDSEIRKLRLRVEKIRKLDGDKTKPNSDFKDLKTADRSRTYQDKPGDTTKKKDKDFEQYSPKEELRLQMQELFEGLKPKIFGADLFKNGEITFEPNLRMATPRSYIIGPDDELLIDLTGDNEKDYQLKVSPDGTIRMEYVGLIAVGGLSVEQAAAKIKRAMTPTYPAMRSGRTNVAVNLGNIRSIKVVLTGAIVKPGTYTLPSLATVFNALYASGGPSENGSFRNIQVIRNNQVVSTIDTYDFLLNGIQKGNIRLQDQDVIHIPVYQTRVEVAGEVKRFALYETVTGETFADVLKFAGGFSSEAYRAKVKVLQNTATERKIIDIDANAFNQYKPSNGDKFVVEPILDRFENRVEITGAVFRPGQFELDKGLTLKQLIQKAEGLTEDAFLYRGYINRLNPDNSPALISFDVSKILDGSATDIPLQREDKVTISSIFDLRDEYKVSIQGEVREPGDYDFANQMKLEDLIQMAGGFKEGATPSRVEVSRRIKNSDANSASARTAEIFIINVDQNLKLLDQKFTLEPFDIVSIRNAEGYTVQRQVKIEGEVLSPGPYTISRKDERISDIIKRAGGLTSLAYADGASLKRPGTEKSNPTNKNAIDNKEEEDKKILNLKRVQQAGVKDTLSIEKEKELIQSDLVGIDLTKILKKPKGDWDLIVEDGDVIRVPKMLQIVKITGEVLNPNSIIFKPGRNLKQYINGAGGFTTNALKKNVYIKYANGSAEAAKRFLFFNNYPKIKPGAEIFVPKRAEREPMTTQGWIAISTGLASMAAIIITLFR